MKREANSFSCLRRQKTEQKKRTEYGIISYIHHIHPSYIPCLSYLCDGVGVALRVRPERLSCLPQVEKLDQAVLPGGAETAVVPKLVTSIYHSDVLYVMQNKTKPQAEEEKKRSDINQL